MTAAARWALRIVVGVLVITAALPAAATVRNIPAGAGGSRAAQYRIVDAETALVNAARPGTTIRVSLYSLTLPGVKDALIRAHKRGVNVQVVTWQQGARSKTMRALAAGIRRNAPGQQS